jgi:uncharacterized protein YjbI with pentapeptide repeats
MTQSTRPKAKKENTPLSIQPPRLSPADLTLWLDEDFLESDRQYSRLIGNQRDLSGVIASCVELSEVRLTKIALQGTNFTPISLTDVALDDSDLANAVWPKSSWQRVVVKQSRLLGIQCNEANISDVLFTDCNLQLSQFRFAEFERVRFERCDLTGGDFHGADLRHAVFDDCELKDVDFHEGNLSGADIRTSRSEGVRIGPDKLRGLVVSPMQAVQLASVFGLVVKFD